MGVFVGVFVIVGVFVNVGVLVCVGVFVGVTVGVTVGVKVRQMSFWVSKQIAFAIGVQSGQPPPDSLKQ